MILDEPKTGWKHRPAPLCLRDGLHAGIAVSDSNERRAMEIEEGGRRLAMLRLEHRDLDAAIHALAGMPQPDQIQIARLKKRKLRLRDEIALVQDALLPDIIA